MCLYTKHLYTFYCTCLTSHVFDILVKSIVSPVKWRDLFDLYKKKIVFLKVRDTTVSNGRMFHASGSVTVGRSGENFGGVVYSYTNSEVLLWTPSAPTGHLIYVGGVWGGGVDSMAVNDAQITIKVVKTGGAGNIQTGS